MSVCIGLSRSLVSGLWSLQPPRAETPPFPISSSNRSTSNPKTPFCLTYRWFVQISASPCAHPFPSAMQPTLLPFGKCFSSSSSFSSSLNQEIYEGKERASFSFYFLFFLIFPVYRGTLQHFNPVSHQHDGDLRCVREAQIRRVLLPIVGIRNPHWRRVFFVLSKNRF